ncbi:hypothetical protein DL770_010575 [Monosporascus sp. CRB-9-2]|nr:hypothetical protein DL770_010575 [Monosporascus sp. CRB-9-2]
MPPRANRGQDGDSDEDQPSLPRDFQRVLDSQKGYPALLADAKKWMTQHKPSLKKQELDALLPRSVYEAAWTALDDLHVRQAWQSDPMRPFMLERRSNTLMPPLWRYVPRFYGRFVEEIIGPEFDLAVDDSGNTVIVVAGQERRHPYWSDEFCRKMMQLLTHQMWLEQPGALAVCLQYVVRCRTNDQRRMVWPRQNYTADKFFDVYQRVMRTSQDGTLTVVQVHNEVARQMGVPSPYSRLFRTVEKSSFRDSVTSLQGQLAAPSVGTYTIATSDLTTLVKALDSQVDQHGLPLYRPAQLTAAAVKAAKAAKASYDLPRDVDLEDYRDQGGYLEPSDLGIDDGDEAGLFGADFSPLGDDPEFSMPVPVSPLGLESYSNATSGSSLQQARSSPPSLRQGMLPPLQRVPDWLSLTSHADQAGQLGRKRLLPSRDVDGDGREEDISRLGSAPAVPTSTAHEPRWSLPLLDNGLSPEPETPGIGLGTAPLLINAGPVSVPKWRAELREIPPPDVDDSGTLLPSKTALEYRQLYED